MRFARIVALLFTPSIALFASGALAVPADHDASEKAIARAEDSVRNVLMIAGAPSHGFGSHEHFAGLRILAESVQASSASTRCTVVRGWPKDETLIDRADSIVIYGDGGKRHPAFAHRAALRRKLATGAGFVCIHYATEMLPGESGDDMVDLLGGHFEVHYSVNPHWVAEFDSLPDHPVTRGVQPFAANDEWYFHLRFAAQGVTPILSAVPPETTLNRPDGHHSGNPLVRKAVERGEPQTVAWTFDRPGGGRSFGITGGHYHWNWGRPDMLRLVTNAIRWTAGDSIQHAGSSLLSNPVTIDDLLQNQAYDPPAKFTPASTAEAFQIPTASAVRPEAAIDASDASQDHPDPTAGNPDSTAGTNEGDEAESTAVDPRSPAAALAGIAMADGLQATLSASEPELRSLTNLDVDDRGRVWVCDVMNYRRNNDSRPAGDRILILQDTTGDGVMDNVKTYYQGRDIDSAMGICVLGNQVIVTATPNVWRFTDDDGDDIPDRKEALFTETGQPQHDHSAHSFLFGPDGKLYWNFGNTGLQVKDAGGKTVVDIHGRPVIDNGKPFYGGMPFRCDLDGSNFEVLAHNFRNNWETTVDSFGTLWQSDNDDDGNRATRINFVMEHGNYGYRDELTGAGWRDDRITLEREIPDRHWHLNDPGVVPNVLQTGAGSPSGICVYEGRLLPERFWDQVIHCDPGPNVVRAYPMQPAGAGYTGSIAPVMTGTTDKWFRPADVCVAPDGSLFVTDWYDPGVGGHRQADLDRGRLFRIAPPGVGYQIPEFDYETPAGAVAALQNPNLSVRYKAWTAIRAMGENAEAELVKLSRHANPRLAARAFWLLGRLGSGGPKYVRAAMRHSNPNVRITGIRLSRQLGMTPAETLVGLASDPSPAVRREVAVALRFDTSDAMPTVWASLAGTLQAGDRWFLEALGIASDLRPDECFDAWIQSVGDAWDNPAGREIVWRVRARGAAQRIAHVIADPQLSVDDTRRYFRALEYLDADARTAALKTLLDLEPSPRNDVVVLRAAERIPGFELKSHAKAADAVRRRADRVQGSAEYLRLASRFDLNDADEQAEAILLASTDNSLSVAAVEFLCDRIDGRRRLRKLLRQKDPKVAADVAAKVGFAGNARTTQMLLEMIAEPAAPYPVRSSAVRGSVKNNLGEKQLLTLAREGHLPADLRLLVGGLLAQSRDEATRTDAAKILPQPRQVDRKPLAPLDQLVRLRGDATAGENLFRGTATCNKCHLVGDNGKQVGPDLSEIGSKLSREALFTSVLDPSAGISHNYENHIALLDSGQIVTGIQVSRTDETLVLRTPDAIDRTIDSAEILEVKKSDKSIMPDNLHHLFDQQGLVDLVEYMVTLKKRAP